MPLNYDVTDLFQMVGTGILNILDDECKLLNPSVHNFICNVHNTNKTSQKLVQENRSPENTSFTVRHFVCNVTYDSVCDCFKDIPFSIRIKIIIFISVQFHRKKYRNSIKLYFRVERSVITKNHFQRFFYGENKQTSTIRRIHCEEPIEAFIEFARKKCNILFSRQKYTN